MARSAPTKDNPHVQFGIFEPDPVARPWPRLIDRLLRRPVEPTHGWRRRRRETWIKGGREHSREVWEYQRP